MKKLLYALMFWPFAGLIRAVNIAEGTHAGSISRLADAATAEYLLVKKGSDNDHIAVNGVADCPLGTLRSTPAAAEDSVTVDLLGCANETKIMIASEPIAAGVEVYTAAAGQIQDASTSITYYKVGVSITEATEAGQEIEVDPCCPIKVVVA